MRHRLCAPFCVVIALFAWAAPTYAQRVGEPLPAFSAKGLDGATRAFPPAGRALVLCWEDDVSSKTKQAAHAVIGRYSDRPSNREIFELVVVADLARWDFWPARSHALAAVKKTQTKESTPVWIDWKGALRKAAGLRKAESAFFVVGADGRIHYFAQGVLDEPQRRALDAAIAGLGAQPVPGR